MKLLFAINQEKATDTEDAILKACVENHKVSFDYKKEYDLSGIKSSLITEAFDVVFLNEELERDNSIATTFIDELTDKYSETRIIMLVASYHETDPYIKRLFNLGVYDILYTHDISLEAIAELVSRPRTKAEAKEYLSIYDVDDAVVENELRTIPDEQLYNILSFLDRTEPENMIDVFEHIYGQYNKDQLVHLYRNLSEQSKEQLIGSELFKEIEDVALTRSKVQPEAEDEEIDEVEDDVKDRRQGLKFKAMNIGFSSPKPSRRDDEISALNSDMLIGSVFIGIANSSRGAGSSFVSIALASYLRSIGGSVAVIEINPDPFFFNMVSDKSKPMSTIDGVDYYYMNKTRKGEYPIPDFKKNYQYVISDLGMIKTMEDGIYKNGTNFSEFLRCSVKILMINGMLWKWGELYPFLLNENMESWNLFVSPASKKVRSMISKDLSDYKKNICYLPYCQDPFEPSDELIESFNKALGGKIGIVGKKKKKILPSFGFGIK